MKKISFLVACAGLALLPSCQEIGPNIDFGVGVKAGEDTTYTANPETAQAKKVLAEEFTGVSCPPCPKGHELMKSIKTNVSGNLVVIAYHIFNYPQASPVTDPAHPSKNDFRTQDATDMANSVFGGLSGMPSGGFDRVPVSGSTLLTTGQWSNAALTEAAKSTPVNIHIESGFDAGSREATVKVTLAYTANVSLAQNLTLAITEDSIVDVQKHDLEVDLAYVHEHVLRDIITELTGIQIPSKVDPKVPGRVYERTFKFQVNAAWVPEHCNIIAFITNNSADNRVVVNAEEVKLIK